MSFTLNDIYPALKKQFPKQNDFYPCSYAEEFEELLVFGIDSVEKLEELLSKHAAAVMEEDSAVEVDEATYEYFCEELGKSVVDERLEKGFWYSYPALLRLTLEEEFGDKYIEYAFSRDGIEE